MSFETIRWEGDLDGACVIVDQTRLPGVFEELTLVDVESMWEAIKRLSVRGAPAIGVAGAYGMVLALRRDNGHDIKTVEKFKDYLDSSRPTAVNLEWATGEILAAAERAASIDGDIAKAVFERAREIDHDDRERCAAIGHNGADLVPEGGVCLTHCNAGALATAGRGTALSVFYAAQQQGKSFQVFADETRPLNQGSRLTAWELAQSGIDVTVITDSMAGFLMKSRKVDLIVTGADRIAANGDAANKIGTYSLALLAREHGVPFYVAAPLSTFDFSLADGSGIPIEEREPEEIRNSFGHVNAPEGVKIWNPAFDVTPAGLIHGLITDKGLILPDSDGQYVKALEQFGVVV